MSHFDMERTCGTCSKPFRLSEHGVAGAQAIAQALDAGTLAESDAPPIVRTCPGCLGTQRMDATEANAEMFRLEHAVTLAKGRKIPRDTKTYASGLAFIGLCFAAGSLAFGSYRGHTVLSWSGVAFGLLMTLSGVVIGVVAFRRVFGRRNSQL